MVPLRSSLQIFPHRANVRSITDLTLPVNVLSFIHPPSTLSLIPCFVQEIAAAPPLFTFFFLRLGGLYFICTCHYSFFLFLSKIFAKPLCSHFFSDSPWVFSVFYFSCLPIPNLSLLLFFLQLLAPPDFLPIPVCFFSFLPAIAQDLNPLDSPR